MEFILNLSNIIEYSGHIIGFIGASLIVIAFYLEQKDKLDSKSIKFSLANSLGSTLIILGMIISNTINIPSLILETIWGVTASVTLYKTLTKNKSTES